MGLGYRVMEGPEVELDYYNFTALNHPPGHPGADGAGHLLHPIRQAWIPSPRIDPHPTSRELVAGAALPPGPEDVVLRTHTSPMQVRAMEDRSRRSSSSSPVAATAATPSTPPTARSSTRSRASPWRRASPSPTSRGPWTSSRGPCSARALRALPARLLPVHRAERRSGCLVLPLWGSGGLADGSGDSVCKGTGWIEILGSGMVDPNVFGFVGATGYDPEGRSRASPSEWGSSGSRCSSMASPTCASSSRTTCECWSSSVEGPLLLAREHCDRPERRGARRAAGAADHRGRADLPPGASLHRGFVVGRVVSVEPAPRRRPADPSAR